MWHFSTRPVNLLTIFGEIMVSKFYPFQICSINAMFKVGVLGNGNANSPTLFDLNLIIINISKRSGP